MPMDQFELQNKLFGLFIADTALCTVLGIADNTDIGLCDSKMRRIAADSTLLKPEDLPFFDYSFIPNYGQMKNYKVNRSTLEFNIYTPTLDNAGEIFRELKKILQENFEEAQIYYAGQASSGVSNVYRWNFRVHLLVSS